ncbi:hypothetical protein [Zooshikella sp. RANM57]|uniref:hypothetical protein n=1 Tax=Zooshikella sp. RANM57 TaxID=3425863 RepID=UPI003D6F8386
MAITTTDGWVVVHDKPINGFPWLYRRLIDPDHFQIRYATPHGDWVEKIGSLDLLGELPEPDDHIDCVVAGHCLMDDDDTRSIALLKIGVRH